MTFLERTRDPRRLRHWVGDMEADYIYTSGIAGETFFRALRDEGRILGVRCPNCRLTYLPPRMFCERCFAELTDFVDVPQEGQVACFSVAHVDRHEAPISPPEVWALVAFRGVHGGLLHRVLARPEEVRIGLRVRPRLRPREARTGTILDIEGFEPVPSQR